MAIAKPWTFVSGQVIASGLINDDFDYLYSSAHLGLTNYDAQHTVAGAHGAITCISVTASGSLEIVNGQARLAFQDASSLGVIVDLVNIDTSTAQAGTTIRMLLYSTATNNITAGHIECSKEATTGWTSSGATQDSVMKFYTALNGACGSANTEGLRINSDKSVNIPNGILYANAGLTVTGALSVSGSMLVSGNIVVTGNLTLTGNVITTGSTALSNLSVSGNASINGSLAVTGTATVTGAVTLSTSLTQATMGSGATTAAFGALALSTTLNSSLTATAETTVTGASIVLETSGRPVKIELMHVNYASGATVAGMYTASTAVYRVTLKRDSTGICATDVLGGAGNHAPDINVVDVPSAGTYTYSLTALKTAGTDVLNIQQLKLTAYER